MTAARAFVREAGVGPAVVCIHATASSSAQWRPLMDRLGGHFRTLAVDLYGSGKSPRWPDDQTLRVPGLAGAYVATGHGPWGMLNAPATGLALAELITDGAPSLLDLRVFDPAR